MTTRRQTLIFANGEIEEMGWIVPMLAGAEVIIAANGGSRHLLALDARPNVVIGDLDSLPPGLEKQWSAGGTQFLAHAAAKDETDLELALHYAMSHSQANILLLGALGGRMDQTLANIGLLANPALSGRHIEVVTEGQRGWLVADRTDIAGAAGDLVSLLPFGGDAHVAATAGLRWPLRNEVLAFGTARGVSNEMTAARATVKLASGRLFCVHSGGRKKG